MTEGRLLLGSLAVLAAVVALIMASPDADADPAPLPGRCQEGALCDPLTLILGTPPVPSSTATTWQDLLLPPTLRGAR